MSIPLLITRTCNLLTLRILVHVFLNWAFSLVPAPLVLLLVLFVPPLVHVLH